MEAGFACSAPQPWLPAWSALTLLPARSAQLASQEPHVPPARQDILAQAAIPAQLDTTQTLEPVVLVQSSTAATPAAVEPSAPHAPLDILEQLAVYAQSDTTQAATECALLAQ